eukprot:TRINITY_DN722_c0_g1_i1.p2 TRINITY_DN722_c0_g1~~TRINITY_DN722_c0_g1_i1.p2  ORF type:complete len:501 (+),score=171.90 TRINITY_DN722_c0_g1_i1:50-1552(+)
MMSSRFALMVVLLSTCCEALRWQNSDLDQCLCWDAEKDNWCKGSDMWNQCEDYWNTYAKWVVISLFGAAFVLVGCVIYYVMRCLACCHKICCSSKWNNGVTTPVLTTYRCFLLVVFITLSVTTGCGVHYRKTDVDHGFKEVNRTLTQQTDTLRSLTSQYTNTTNSLLKDINGPHWVADDAVLRVENNINTWTGNINDKQDDIVSHLWVLDMFMWPALLTTFIVLLCNLFKLHRVFPEVLVFFVALTAYLAFTLQFTSGAVNKAARDTCIDYSPLSDRVMEIIDTKMGGCNASGKLGYIINSTVFIEQSYVNESCVGDYANTLYELCRNGSFSCDTCDSMDTVSSVITNGSRMLEADWGCLGCTIEECATGCTAGSAVQVASQEVVARDARLTEGVAELKEKAYPIAECKQFREMIDAAYPSICYEFKPNVYDYWETAGAAAFAVMFAFALATLGNIMYPEEASLLVYNVYAPQAYTGMSADEETALHTQKQPLYSNAPSV